MRNPDFLGIRRVKYIPKPHNNHNLIFFVPQASSRLLNDGATFLIEGYLRFLKQKFSEIKKTLPKRTNAFRLAMSTRRY